MTGYSPTPPYRGRHLRKGTRMLRTRTLYRAGNPGQPVPELTDPKRIRAQGNPARHTCSECFGPRSAYRRGYFCARCEQALFGTSYNGQAAFIRSERQFMVYQRRRWQAAGVAAFYLRVAAS